MSEVWISAIGIGVTVIGATSAAVFRLTWFFSTQLDGIKSAYVDSLATHEERDRVRHEQNLARFEKINLSLARLSNGAHRPFPEDNTYR